MASIEEVRAILDSGNFEAFVDLRESQWFDAKGREPYNLTGPMGRYELAKDVCAFCNAEGGYLVIGLQHEPLLDENTERISGLDLLGEAELDLETYRGVIREYLYPEVKGMSVEWRADAGQPELGVLYIHIPPQHQDAMPFLIRNVVEEGQLLRHIVFGMARRVGAASVPLSIHELQNRVKHGMHSVAERLTSIERKLDSVLEERTQRVQGTPLSRLAQRIRDIL